MRDVWQVIKENRLVVRGRHEERTSELVSKSKYSKEFDLGERIEDQSVRGGVSADGRLFVTALVKGHGQRVVKGHGQRVVKGHGQRVVMGHGQRVVMGRHGQRVVMGHGQTVVMGHGQ